jgi:nitroreductase
LYDGKQKDSDPPNACGAPAAQIFLPASGFQIQISTGGGIMSVLAAIQNRYSCRAYQDKPIEQEKLDRIIEAARLAPSARNLQEWRFLFVRDPQIRQQMQVAANNQPFVSQAAVVIAACAENDYVMRCGQRCGPIDVAIALEHIALQAVAEGLGICWIGSFFPEQVRKVLGIPEDVAVIELMTLGYPADQPRAKTRVAAEKIACYDRWEF